MVDTQNKCNLAVAPAYRLSRKTKAKQETSEVSLKRRRRRGILIEQPENMYLTNIMPNYTQNQNGTWNAIWSLDSYSIRLPSVFKSLLGPFFDFSLCFRQSIEAANPCN